jgi:hypothetical protein
MGLIRPDEAFDRAVQAMGFAPSQPRTQLACALRSLARDGFLLMPETPTEEMIAAGSRSCCDELDHHSGVDDIEFALHAESVYPGLIRARPRFRDL